MRKPLDASMDYTQDPQFLLIVFVMPLLFGLSLLGEGVSKIVNYDPRGWVGVVAGMGFIGILVLAYFMVTSGNSFL